MIINRMNYWIIPAITKCDNRYDDDAVKNAIHDVLGVSPQQIESKNRFRPYVEARQIYCYLMRKHTTKTMKYIAQSLGGRDHSTAIHSIRQVEDRLDSEEFTGVSDLKNTITSIENQLIIL